MRALLGRVRGLLGSVRDVLDGRLHSRRRARSIRALEEISRNEADLSILFVCLGNVCRSPYAAWALSRSLDGGNGVPMEVGSAGFIGPGRSPPERAVEAALERGIDHRTNVSRLLTEEMARDASVLLVFDRYNLQRLKNLDLETTPPTFLLGDFDPIWAGKRAIVDPWDEPLEEFRRIFARIDRCVETVQSALTEGRLNG